MLLANGLFLLTKFRQEPSFPIHFSHLANHVCSLGAIPYQIEIAPVSN